jgi:tRNA 2-selenouridine synthase
MKYLDISEFVKTAARLPIVDVRSPGEFEAGHIPGATNIPIFSNEERKEVGIRYKEQGQLAAIELGLELVGPQLLAKARAARDLAVDGQLLVHCWRGGMRSEKMAWLFELVGLRCRVLTGGYKAYRQTIARTFTDADNVVVLHGATGSGKTEILQELKALGQQVIDLEGLANHRGSAFGGIGQGPQPTTEQFQNDVLWAYLELDPARPVWLENEGISVGHVNVPQALFERMRSAPLFEVVVPRPERVKRLVREYGELDRDAMARAITRITRRLGGERAKRALELLAAGELATLADLLLEYYDRAYTQSRDKYKLVRPKMLTCPSDDARANAQLLCERINKHYDD